MSDLLRDAPIGQFIRWASNKKYLRYPDEEPGFQIPKRWTTMTKAATSKDDFASKADSALSSPRSDRSASWWRISMVPYDFKNDFFDSYLYDDDEKALRDSGSMGSILMKRPASTSTMGNVGNAEMVVDWYNDQDADNPQNWSDRKRALATVIICLYTFVVYTSSAIYVSSTQGVMDEFHVSQLSATLGLSLYVLGYGVGPLIFSPLGEMPTIGRNPVYIVTMALFVIVSLPTAFAPDFASLIVLRFLQGFFGSPCLASGGATLADMYSMNSLPYAMLAWVSASYCGRKFLIHQRPRLTALPTHTYTRILTVDFPFNSGSGTTAQRLFSACQELAMVALRDHLGCRAHLHHDVHVPARDEQREDLARPCCARVKNRRQGTHGGWTDGPHFGKPYVARRGRSRETD